MKKAKRWTSKSQYAAPRDKQHGQSIGAFNIQVHWFVSMNGKHRLPEQLG